MPVVRPLAHAICFSLCFALVGPGCDSASGGKDAAAEAAAKKEKEEEEKQKRIDERRKKREAEEAEKKKAEEEKQAKLDAICVLPETLPKKVDKACEEVATAQDGFMQRLYADKPETIEKWNNAKGTQIPLTVTQCKKAGSLEVAACQKHALESATVELKKEIPGIFRTCIDKFGKPPEADGAAG